MHVNIESIPKHRTEDTLLSFLCLMPLALELLTCGINEHVHSWVEQLTEMTVCESRKQHSQFILTSLNVNHKAQSTVYPSGGSFVQL